jgi:hypothetical protein
VETRELSDAPRNPQDVVTFSRHAFVEHDRTKDVTCGPRIVDGRLPECDGLGAYGASAMGWSELREGEALLG